MDALILKMKYFRSMVPIYSAMLLFSFHYYITNYVNSSFLEQYWSKDGIGMLYIIGSIITIVLFLFSTYIIEKMHTFGLLLAFLLLELTGTVYLFIGHSALLSGVGFVLTQASVSLLYFIFDIYLQKITVNSSKVGNIRSVFLTLGNLTVVVTPFLSAALIKTYSYSGVYAVSLFFLLPLFFLGYAYFKKLPDSTISHLSITKTIGKYAHNKNLRRIFEANLVLKIFYGVMTIYLPLYLLSLGFDWDKIGIMLAIMLLPFVVFEIPFGIIADKFLGEKEIMIAGFILAGISTSALYFVTKNDFILITIILFLSRIGASAIEIMTETYFFKKVNGNSTDLISFFRITTPLSYVVAPILCAVVLINGTYSTIFFVLGFCTLLGIIPALFIKDTK